MRAVLLGLLSAVLFGASTPVSKLLLAELTPLQLAGLLYLGGAVGAAAPAWVRRRGGSLALPRDARNRFRLAGAVALGGGVAPVLMLFGLWLSRASSVSLILNLELAFTAVLGVWLFRDALHRSGWLGAGAIFAAGVLASSDGGWPGLRAGGLVALACSCWALDNHWTALIDGITPAASTFWKGLVAGVVNLGFGVALDDVFAPWTALGGALVVGTLAYGLSISLYIACAQQVGATRAQGLFALAPFVGAALSFAALGERPTPAVLAAAGLSAVGVWLLLRARHEHEHFHPALEHVHSHRHDDGHHAHAHETPVEPGVRHSHWHRHEPQWHRHPHWPDLHHRHAHEEEAPPG